MIIFGIRSAHVHTTPSEQATCPHCGTKGSTILSIFRKHLHIFWIPLFPLNKFAASECQHCKQVLQKKELTAETMDHYQKLKKEVRGPIWQYAGLIIFFVLFLLVGMLR